MSIIIPNPPDQPGSAVAATLEMDVQRKLTHEFILTQPVVVTLIPRTQTRTPTGGYTWTSGTPRAAQTMRLIEPSLSGAQYRVAQGVARDVEFELLGEWDSTIGLYDIFSYDGREWEVQNLFHYNGYERRASVVRHGG